MAAIKSGGHLDCLNDRPYYDKYPKFGTEFGRLNRKPEESSNAYNVVIKESVINTLKNYMLCHEGDIAFGINDFDELRHPFEALIGRQAEPKDHNGIKVINGKRVI